MVLIASHNTSLPSQKHNLHAINGLCITLLRFLNCTSYFESTKRTINISSYEAYAHLNGYTNSNRVEDIKVLCKSGKLKEALRILSLIDCEDRCAGFSIYDSLLHGCLLNRALPETKLVHAHIIQTGFRSQNILLDNKLLSLYAKRGSLLHARMVFDQIPERNVVSWTAMMAAYVRNGLNEEALKLFYQMKQAGVRPDQFTFATILPVCAGLGALEQGKEIHEEIMRAGFQSDVFVDSALIDMYVKCGSIEDARDVFDKMPERNAVSWTAMVAGYAHNGHIGEALKLFRKMPERDAISWNAIIAGCAQNRYEGEALAMFWDMQRRGIRPDQFTFASIIPACANLAAIERGREVHGAIIRRGLQSDVFVGSALVDMYGKCGCIENAHKVFDKMSKQNVVSWNAMIGTYVQNRNLDEALKLFHKMPERDVVSWNAMVAGYVQNGQFGEALKFFDRMPERNVVSWTTIVVGYAQSGHVDEAFRLFQKMPERNVVSWNAMIAGYAQNGLVDKALELFQKMPERDVVTWNSMIAGYAQNDHLDEALKLFGQLQFSSAKPDSETFASVLPACSNMAALQHGKEVHEKIIRAGLMSDVFVGSALVDMYAKCGSIEDSYKLFDGMPVRNVVSWNAMIVGYAMHGHGKESLQLFEEMKLSGCNPDHITFLGVLSGCCHAGLVNDGWRYFNSMSQYYCITPTMEHYSCMVDLLGRAGLLDDAQDFIKKMPVEPNATIWGSLLAACKAHINIELAENVAECLFKLDPNNAAPYVMLSNIYAVVGKWDHVQKVRKMMKDGRIEKTPGCSWIEINKQVHAFLVGEKITPTITEDSCKVTQAV